MIFRLFDFSVFAPLFDFSGFWHFSDFFDFSRQIAKTKLFDFSAFRAIFAFLRLNPSTALRNHGRQKGCLIKRKGQPALEVTLNLVQGCPLISREQGLRLLAEYEAIKDKGGISFGQASMIGK